MFDMRSLTPSFFEVTLPNNVSISVKPPKMRIYRKIISFAKDVKDLDYDQLEVADNLFNELSNTLASAFSSNKQDRKFTGEEFENMLDFDQLLELFLAYFNWANEISNSKN